MKPTTLLIPAVLAFGLIAGGCVVRGGVGMSARATGPDLVYVSPGVYVIEDYHEPIFYSDNYYWRYHNGIWYRSRVYNGSWVRVRTVPRAVSRIDRPRSYVRYRGSGKVHRTNVRRPEVRDHRSNRPSRDHRSNRPAVRDHRRSTPARDRGPAVRDHRKAKPRDRGPEVRDHRKAKPKKTKKKRQPKKRDHRKRR